MGRGGRREGEERGRKWGKVRKEKGRDEEKKGEEGKGRERERKLGRLRSQIL